jgi:hypothetical protein
MLPASENCPAFLFPKGSGVVPVTYNVYNRYIKYFLNKAVTGQSGEPGIETKGV